MIYTAFRGTRLKRRPLALSSSGMSLGYLVRGMLKKKGAGYTRFISKALAGPTQLANSVIIASVTASVISYSACAPIASSFSKLNPPFARKLLQANPSATQVISPAPSATATPTAPNSASNPQVSINTQADAGTPGDNQISYHSNRGGQATSDGLNLSAVVSPLAIAQPVSQQPAGAPGQAEAVVPLSPSPTTVSSPAPTAQEPDSTANHALLYLSLPDDVQVAPTPLPLYVAAVDCSNDGDTCEDENLALLAEFREFGRVPVPAPSPHASGRWLPTAIEISWFGTDPALGEEISQSSCASITASTPTTQDTATVVSANVGPSGGGSLNLNTRSVTTAASTSSPSLGTAPQSIGTRLQSRLTTSASQSTIQAPPSAANLPTTTINPNPALAAAAPLVPAALGTATACNLHAGSTAAAVYERNRLAPVNQFRIRWERVIPRLVVPMSVRP